jgi:hypothetical protein
LGLTAVVNGATRAASLPAPKAAPAGSGVATGAIALFMLHRWLSLKAFDDRVLTAELALKDVLSAKATVEGVVNGRLVPAKS